MTSKPRRFRGFAVIERPAGALIWGTLRPSRDEARALFDKWNPSLEGQSERGDVVAVEVVFHD